MNKLILTIFFSFSISSILFSSEITIDNFKDREIIRYPVALLIGSVENGKDEELTVSNRSSKRPSHIFKTSLVGGKYKALIELVTGNNHLTLSCGKNKIKLNLTYKLMTTKYVVRMIYLTDSSGNSPYESPIFNDPKDYWAKLDIVAKLMQTFTAESMNEQGYGRKTFNLELDKQGKVIVHNLAAPHSAAYYRAKTGDEIYGELYPWIDTKFPMEHGKNVVLMGFTHYDPTTKKPSAHTALGGGGLGLFGSLGMFSWPSTLQQVQPAFYDATKIDTNAAFDDTAYRSTYWGLAATTIGATMHETGHTFGLPHDEDPHSVMSRGFDYFNRMFTFYEPPSGRNKETFYFTDADRAIWDKEMSAKLAVSPWFQMD